MLFHYGAVDFAVFVSIFTEGVNLYLVILPVPESQAHVTGIVDTLADYLPLAIVIEEEWAEHIELVPTLSRHAGHLRTEHRRSTLTFQSRSCKIDFTINHASPKGSAQGAGYFTWSHRISPLEQSIYQSHKICSPCTGRTSRLFADIAQNPNRGYPPASFQRR